MTGTRRSSLKAIRQLTSSGKEGALSGAAFATGVELGRPEAGRFVGTAGGVGIVLEEKVKGVIRKKVDFEKGLKGRGFEVKRGKTQGCRE